MAVITPLVAVVYESRIVLLFIDTVFAAAVDPIPFSIAVNALDVAPERTVTELLLIVADALVPAWA